MLTKEIEQYMRFLGLIEEYIVTGVSRDIANGRLKDWEWKRLFELARLQVDVPGMFNRYVPQSEPSTMAISEAKEDNQMSDKLVLFKQGADDENPAGFTVGKSFLEMALSKHSKAVGLAAFVDGKFELHREVPEAGVPLDFMEGVFNTFVKSDVLAFLSNDTDIAAVQPFTIIGDQDSPELIGMLQGDPGCLAALFEFIKKRREKEDTFAEFWEYLENNPGKIKDLLIGDSALVLMGTGGDILVFDNNGNIAAPHDWGLSFGEKIEVDVKPVEPKPADAPKSSAFGSISKSNTPAMPTTLPAEGKRKPPEGAKVAVINRTDLQYIDVKLHSRIDPMTCQMIFKNEHEPFVQCPRYIIEKDESGKEFHRNLSKEEASEWYRVHLGFRVKNWKPENNGPNPIIPVSFLKVPVESISLADLSASASARILGKKTNTVHLPPSQKWTDQDVKDFEADWGPRVLQSSGAITNPLKIVEEQEKYETIWSKTGKEAHEFVMTWATLVAMCKEAPETAARFLSHWQYMWVHEHQHAFEIAAAGEEKDAEIAELKKQIEALVKPNSKPTSAFGSVKK